MSLAAALVLAAGASPAPVVCPPSPVALQVLGSGGPIAESDRAGTSYFLRIDGVPRVLIDSGPGSFLRFAQAGGSLATLDAIIISHLHVDHSADLTGLLKSGSFEDTRAPIVLIGPDGTAVFPSIREFLTAQLAPKTGAYRYLSGYLDGRTKLDVRQVVTAQGNGKPMSVALAHGIKLTAIPVNHGVVPALAVKLKVSGKTIVIGGDQSAFSSGFEASLAGSAPDLLVAHHVIPEGEGQPRGLHRPPGSIGELAAGLRAKSLVLSHNMRRSLDRLDEGLAAIRAHYAGPVTVANDLDCFTP